MSYNITKMEVYSKTKKIKHSEVIEELIDGGYYPPYYEKEEWDKWMSKISKNEKIAVVYTGDYGIFVDIYFQGRLIKSNEVTFKYMAKATLREKEGGK